MWALFFLVTAILCAEKWCTARITEMALIKYMKDKNFPWPSAEEFDECCDYAWKAFLHLP